MPNEPRYDVVLLNDDETPMEFVVHVLQVVFEMEYDDACTLMLGVHHNGKAVCGIYGRAEAEAKVASVLALASAQNHPLKCILEAWR